MILGQTSDEVGAQSALSPILKYAMQKRRKCNVYVDDVAETKYKVMSRTRNRQGLILGQELISSKPNS